MITKEDAKDYLDQMLAVEKKMENTYKDLITKLKDENLIRTFDSMMKDEQDHYKLVLELIDLMEKWI